MHGVKETKFLVKGVWRSRREPEDKAGKDWKGELCGQDCKKAVRGRLRRA